MEESERRTRIATFAVAFLAALIAIGMSRYAEMDPTSTVISIVSTVPAPVEPLVDVSFN
jgi:hypothetical protein